MKRGIIYISLLLSVVFLLSSLTKKEVFIDYIAKVNDNLVFVWKDSSGNPIKTFSNLKLFFKQNNTQLQFAMNGGMYMTNNAPLGLYIEKCKTLAKLNTRKGSGNFYMEPNGVFYITKSNTAKIVTTQQMGQAQQTEAKYATQSGPMLLINGSVHKAFKKGSKNFNIRNGVGILPNGELLFSMSSNPVNFYDFAMHFKSKGCKNALYLDGYVSKMYYPEKELKGSAHDRFGVMIAVGK